VFQGGMMKMIKLIWETLSCDPNAL
jgi:hypothetical protein